MNLRKDHYHTTRSKICFYHANPGRHTAGCWLTWSGGNTAETVRHWTQLPSQSASPPIPPPKIYTPPKGGTIIHLCGWFFFPFTRLQDCSKLNGFHITRKVQSPHLLRGGGHYQLWRLPRTTFSNGCLGSHNDEERSEMRYVMRIARPRESFKF